ncbi:putative lip/Mn/Versatile peroxidase [Triangularia verruculosa]|uniref:Peroxidase n=1 Tax=Triangularia verruculosa TaxID=2587418 RepID=A0AAN6XDP6_9PEZI|nr:putative lip/Mn/Versatile peroxidase [Triangularia verruculosa]
MKVSSFATALAGGAAMLSTAVQAHPGMMNSSVLEALKEADFNEPRELLGDLLGLHRSELGAVGLLIRAILVEGFDAQTNEYYDYVPPLNSEACVRDTCCVWYYIAEEMTEQFRGLDGQCTDAARGAIRLGYHDAAGWSKFTGDFGGADGSIVLAPEEILRRANNGLEEIVQQYTFWYDRWSYFGVGMADLIQMGANVATVVCPLGPRIRSFVGRHDSSIPAPDGLLPSPFDPAEKLINLFRAKTIQPLGLAALLGAHSTSRQRFVNPARAGAPQDSTPGIWDVLYYAQTLAARAAPDIFRLPSDLVLSEHPRLFPAFKAFAGPNGQAPWDFEYAREYVRLSLLGVFNINNLTDCSRVLPARTFSL